MSMLMTCEAIQAQMREFVEGQIPAAERAQAAAHIEECAACLAAMQRRKLLVGLMSRTLGQMQIPDDFAERATQRLADIDRCLDDIRAVKSESDLPDPEAVTVALVPLPWRDEDEEAFQAEEAAAAGGGQSVLARLGGMPWWGISVALHLLIIFLVSLITMAIGEPSNRDSIVVVTNLEKAPVLRTEDTLKKPDLADILNKKVDTPATDPNSPVKSDIVVPPDILARAEVSDHFETVNPDRPDTSSAFGNPDAMSFHSVSGSDDVEGGGGGGGGVLEETIGVGGAAGFGKGGGWGGGDGNGIGTGSGSGHGSFGQRNGGGRKLLVMRHGGSKATESAVDRGLDWLARNQEADGRWDAQKHGGKHTGMIGDTAMTGYALLAFLGAGHTEKVGKYRENVRKAVKWLIDNEGGVAGGKQHPGRWVTLNYSQGIATMALSEAAGMGRIPDTMKAAQKAVDAVDDAQNRRGGDSDREAWDYGPRGGTNDSSVMAWNIMALKSAKMAGLHVDPVCFQGCLNWLDAGQDLGNMKPGDNAPTDWEGGMMAYRGTVAAPNKGKGGMAVTAAAALCRLHIGGAGLDDPGVAGPCNLMLKPHNLPKKFPFNLYYGYYATLTMFQKGGDHWKAWNENLKVSLPEAQKKGGADDGSWDPVNAGADDDRVMSTALAVLCLEVYYRYLPLYKK
ncbi:MAG: terpene cyclase/mutase family protein [Planctomycetes bacterium]|nr:terpene cyclase/mutase family protein [Planctomycetota bacterium]